MSYLGGMDYRCDAITGRAPDWHTCRAPAQWGRASAYGGTLHYCNAHYAHAAKPRPEQYTPAPGSLPQRITR